MMPPQQGSSRPLMMAPESRKPVAAPSLPDLNALLWCYAAAAGFALAVAHAAL